MQYEKMSRRSPRYRARFAATVQIAGVEHTLVCHTRDISAEGCFLDTNELIAEGVPVELALMDNERGEAVTVQGVVARSQSEGGARGIGVRLPNPPAEWQRVVARYRSRVSRGDTIPPRGRLSILVFGDEEHRRGALALYVTSGWDVRFAVDLESAREALNAIPVDAVIAERELEDERAKGVLEEARRLQPQARRIIRCMAPSSESPADDTLGDLVHRIVDERAGLDALVDALTSDLESAPA